MPHEHSSGTSWDFFTNYGHYMRRLDCLRAADGSPDWPWIIALIVLMTTVIFGYVRIFLFWRRGHLAEREEDRNNKLMDLAWIFLLCAICGYGLSIVMFFWPAYRLLAIMLVFLNFFTWRFAYDLSAFSLSFGAKRLQRELNESLKRRNEELEHVVYQRTAALEEATAAAARANEHKTRFLADMSHEIRTPMTAVMGFADLALEPGLTDAERGDYIETIRRNGRHLLGIINDVLDLTKIEAGKMTVERVSTDLRELIDDTFAGAAPAARERGLTLDVEYAGPVPTRVLTDPLRVRQVLTNLLNNATKFTSAGGVFLRVRHAGPQLTLDVRDTGRGIPAEQLETLFNAFDQGMADTPRRFGGSGLGLTISRRLAGLLGGDLTVESVVNAGSTFTFTLDAPAAGTSDPSVTAVTDSTTNPLAIEATQPGFRAYADASQGTLPPQAVTTGAASAYHRPEVEGRLTGVRLLLAEDAEDSQRLMAYVLGRSGAATDLAPDGVVALRLAREAIAAGRPYDVVLLDMQMPELDGYGVARALRGDGYKQPIVALTANAMSADRDRCFAAGCDDFVSKPVDLEALITVIGRYIKK